MAQLAIFLSVFSTVVLVFTYMTVTFAAGLFPIALPFESRLLTIAFSGALLFIIGIIGTNARPHPLFTLLYKIGSIWMGFIGSMMFFLIPWYAFALVTNTVFLGWEAGSIFLGILIALNAMGLYLAFHPSLTQYQIRLNKEHTWHGKKIVMIADTHYGNIYSEKHAK